MASDKINLEIDDHFVSKLFSLSDSLPPSMSEINISVLKKQLFNIEQYINGINEEFDKLKAKRGAIKQKYKEETSGGRGKSSATAGESLPSYSQAQVQTPAQTQAQAPAQFIIPASQNMAQDVAAKGRVLVIDDLGVITYQLGTIFKKLGYEVATSKEIYEAIEKFKRNIFNFVVMDLFIPTEREGFILLDELKKISNTRQQNTIIGVMSASTRKDHKIMSANKGADFYVEKINDWQKELFAIIDSLQSSNS